MIDILHMTPWPLGGATTFVVNLARVLQIAGIPARVVRPAKRTEPKKRQIGHYGVFYQNVSWEDLEKSKGVPLLASAPTDSGSGRRIAQHVMLNGGKFVFHDPNEFGMYPHWDFSGTKGEAICIRETGLQHVRGVFIPHPFVRTLPDAPLRKRTRLAVSIARTSPVKRSDWIIEANFKLLEKQQVELCGEVNRMWWNFTVSKKWPDLPKPANAGFPREWGAPARICMPFEYMVDLTVFKTDGGGTQYSFLEAMDAGAVPVMSADWCNYPGPAREFGFQVKDADALYRFLKNAGKEDIRQQTAAYRASGYAYLARLHNPVKVAAQYKEALGL